MKNVIRKKILDSILLVRYFGGFVEPLAEQNLDSP